MTIATIGDVYRVIYELEIMVSLGSSDRLGPSQAIKIFKSWFNLLTENEQELVRRLVKFSTTVELPLELIDYVIGSHKDPGPQGSRAV